jgi:fructose-bisphosphate aldolase class I
MFKLMHEMRVRIMSSPAFTGEKVIGAILFEGTMDGQAKGKPVPAFLWEDHGVVPFLKVLNAPRNSGSTARKCARRST